MTIGGALSELNNLLNANDIPCYYKPSIKAVMDTIALSSRELSSVTPQEPNNLGVEKIEVRKPCINYEDGCEEWAGCPCVYYKAESEG